MYLMNQELQMSSRIDIFQFQGCPASLSPLLEPPKRKVNYLHNNEEALSPSAPRRDAAQEKEKQTALTKKSACSLPLSLEKGGARGRERLARAVGTWLSLFYVL